MQWLIDMIIEMIGIPPVFIDRGDPVTRDFNEDDLIWDGFFHELDLSGIVPKGASAVCLNVLWRTTSLVRTLTMRTAGNTNTSNISCSQTQVGNHPVHNDFVLPVGADRKVEYHQNSAITPDISITVKGWWL